MLTSDYLDVLPSTVLELYERYQQSVINDIAKRLAGISYASAAWQVQRLSESGALYDEILKKLSDLTGKSERELKKIFEKAGVKAMAFDDAIYKAAGFEPVPLNLSPAMTNVLKAGYQKTSGILRNLTLTTAITGQNAFIEASDLAYMQVVSGAFSYDQAIRAAVKELANTGLSVINYASGRQDKLDVAVRRTVLTGVNSTCGQLTEKRCDDMGIDLVQTSAHLGARNKGGTPENHEMWQGRVFSRAGQGYPNFYEITGYGTVTGLYGINCRHSHYVFFEGISKNAYDKEMLNEYASKTVTYNGKEMSYYEATQKQRYFERQIRNSKREASAVEAAGLDNADELAKVRVWQARLRDFIKQTELYRQCEREQIL